HCCEKAGYRKQRNNKFLPHYVDKISLFPAFLFLFAGQYDRHPAAIFSSIRHCLFPADFYFLLKNRLFFLLYPFCLLLILFKKNDWCKIKQSKMDDLLKIIRFYCIITDF